MARKKNTDDRSQSYPSSAYNKWYLEYSFEIYETLSITPLIFEGTVPATPAQATLGDHIFGSFIREVHAWLNSSIEDATHKLPSAIEGVKWTVSEGERRFWRGDRREAIVLHVSGFVPKTPNQKKRYAAALEKRKQTPEIRRTWSDCLGWQARRAP